MILTLLLALFSQTAEARCLGQGMCYGWFRDGTGLCGSYTVVQGIQRDFRFRVNKGFCSGSIQSCDLCQDDTVPPRR